MQKRPNSNIFSRLTFWASRSIIGKGKQLSRNDMWLVEDGLKSDTLWKAFKEEWEAVPMEERDLWRSLRKRFWKSYLVLLFFQAVAGVLPFSLPLMLPYIFQYLEDMTIPGYQGWVICGVLVLLFLIAALFNYHAFFGSVKLGLKIRAVLMGMIFDKAMNVSHSVDTGNAITLLSTDASIFVQTLVFVNQGIISPITLGVSMVLLYIQVGWYFLVTLIVLILMIPFVIFVGGQLRGVTLKLRGKSSARLKLINEYITSIQIIKYYTWEKPLIEKITDSREKELKNLRSYLLWRSLLILVLLIAPIMIQAVTFLLYGTFQDDFNYQIVFSAISVFNLIRLPFILLPITFSMVFTYSASIQRIMEFMMAEEHVKQVKRYKEKGVLRAFGNFKNLEGDFHLKKLDIKVRPGECGVVVGSVGAGKSSLGRIFLDEMLAEGKKSYAALGGSLAYTPQEAWIISSTVRNNILMGKKYNKKLYREIISVCALESDFELFENGDQTVIGERGVTLSGGQKQRISIARALYQDKSIFIFDDPLSAVDSKVGRHIFEQAIIERLLRKNKTVLFITNALQYVSQGTHIYHLENGRVSEEGTYQELMEAQGPFQELMINFGEFEQEEVAEKTEKKKKKIVKKDKLFDAEKKEEGTVGAGIYTYYVKKGSIFFFALSVLFNILVVSFRVGGIITLGIWSSQNSTDNSTDTNLLYTGIYSVLGFGEAIFFGVASLVWIVVVLKASRNLHSDLIDSIKNASIQFFYTTPIGRLVSRFSTDMTLIDTLLPSNTQRFINNLFGLFALLVSLAIGSLGSIVLIIIAVIFFMWFQGYYKKSIIEVQRLQSISLAPIYSNFSETMQGISIIRSMGLKKTFEKKNALYTDINTGDLYTLRYCSSWFGLFLDWTASAIAAGTYTYILITRYLGTSDPVFNGLALSAISGLTTTLSNIAQTLAEVETNMNSVERVKSYVDVDQDVQTALNAKKPKSSWPKYGKVEFKNFSMRYFPNKPLVLQDINVVINPGTTVGIVGRTGAGKSTFISALFRLLEPETGVIEIDGVDISTIPLLDLRSRLGIIPQDPTMFIGTYRGNLDLFEEFEDKRLWQVLKMVELYDFVKGLPNKLDSPILEGGSNLSVGQKQLICLARALLRDAQIIVMDEATASVDYETDLIIQKSVRKYFAGKTVITVAHRLNTIIDNDRVLVMDQGRIVEYDRPRRLLRNPDSLFTDMVNATGVASAENLVAIANGEMDLI